MNLKHHLLALFEHDCYPLDEDYKRKLIEQNTVTQLASKLQENRDFLEKHGKLAYINDPKNHNRGQLKNAYELMHNFPKGMI